MSFVDTSCCPPVTTLDADQAGDLAEVLKVLADPARLRIIAMLANTDEVCACDLTAPLGLSQPTVSHHVKVLREAGFVESDRRGKWVYHRLSPGRLEQVRSALAVPVRR